MSRRSALDDPDARRVVIAAICCGAKIPEAAKLVDTTARSVQRWGSKPGPEREAFARALAAAKVFGDRADSIDRAALEKLLDEVAEPPDDFDLAALLAELGVDVSEAPVPRSTVVDPEVVSGIPSDAEGDDDVLAGGIGPDIGLPALTDKSLLLRFWQRAHEPTCPATVEAMIYRILQEEVLHNRHKRRLRELELRESTMAPTARGTRDGRRQGLRAGTVHALRNALLGPPVEPED